MRDQNKTEEQLMKELDKMHHRVAKAEGLAAKLKQAELKLREWEEKYQSILDGARDGIVLIDGETGVIFECNRGFEDLCGRKLEELKKMRIWELRPSELVEADRKKFFEIYVRRGACG